MNKANKTLEAIDLKIVEKAESSHRNHLGGSIIGDSCSRKLWFTFRWAKNIKHSARLYRLFNRGHLEEERLVAWLRDAGIHVWDVDEDGKQFRISNCGGHFGGSLDGIAYGVPDIPEGAYCLLEFKTHGEKSYKSLIKEGMEQSKPQHHIQMQVYMRHRQLQYGLYMAINKNTDDIHMEVVKLKSDLADMYIQRANRIITSKDGEPRIKDNPSWFECKWCDFKYICHHKAPADINCRTCEKATPVADGKWHCKLNQDIEQYKHTGCSNHRYIPAMIGDYNQMSTEKSQDVYDRFNDNCLFTD